MRGRFPSLTARIHAGGAREHLNHLVWLGVDVDRHLERVGLGMNTPTSEISWDAFASFVETAWSGIADPKHVPVVAHVDVHTSCTRAALHYLTEKVTARIWPHLQVALRDRGPGRCDMEVRILEPLAGSRAYLELTSHLFAWFPRRCNQQAARLLDVVVALDARHAVAFFELPDELGTETLSAPEPERSRTQVSVIERLGRALAAHADVHRVAEVVVNDLLHTLQVGGAEVVVRGTPIRMRGGRDGVALTRLLARGNAELGSITLWTDQARAQATQSTLDLVVPWISLALGTAIERLENEEVLSASHTATSQSDAALLGILEAHPAAAYAVDRLGRAVPLNTHGRLALERSAYEQLERIAKAIGETDSTEMSVFRIRAGDDTDQFIVVDRLLGEASIETRLALAASAWGLTKRQQEVAACLLRGEPNKEIAKALGCAEVTIENHLTAIFRRAGVSGRGAFVARVVKGPIDLVGGGPGCR